MMFPDDVQVAATALRRYLDHRVEQQKNAPDIRLRALTWDDLTRQWSADDLVNEILKDPVRSALRGAVRDRPWRAFGEGGMAAVTEFASDVEAAGGNGAILDRWLDGVGRVNGAAGWCS